MVTSYASASGSFVELGRTEVVRREPNPSWPLLETALPAAAPRRLYLRLQVFASQRSGRHQLIGTSGGLVDELGPVRGRALPLQLLTPQRRAGRGVLWLFMYCIGNTFHIYTDVHTDGIAYIHTHMFNGSPKRRDDPVAKDSHP